MISTLNADRAACADAGLSAYASEKEGRSELYDVKEVVITDLLTDLAHLCSQEEVDFERVVAMARQNFIEEINANA